MAFIEPRVGCGVAIVVAQRILLMQRLTAPEAGAWGIAGGKIDLFETAPQAARREVREELGIDVVPIDLLCFVDQIDEAAGTHWVSPVFLVTAYEGEPRIIEPDKHRGLGWSALGALPGPLTTPTLRAVEAWRARASGRGRSAKRPV